MLFRFQEPDATVCNRYNLRNQLDLNSKTEKRWSYRRQTTAPSRALAQEREKNGG